MLAILARLIGFIVLSAGLAALVVDATHSLAASSVVVTPLGENWGALHPASLRGTETVVRHGVEPIFGRWVWDPAIRSLLAAPGFAVLGVVGALFIVIGRKRRRAP